MKYNYGSSIFQLQCRHTVGGSLSTGIEKVRESNFWTCMKGVSDEPFIAFDCKYDYVWKMYQLPIKVACPMLEEIM